MELNKKKWSHRELVQRCQVSFLALMLLVTLFVFIEHPMGQYGFFLVLAATAITAFWEFLHLALPQGDRHYRVVALSCAGLYLAMLSFYIKDFAFMKMMLLAFAMFFVLFVCALRLKENMIKQISVTFFGLFYVVICLGVMLPIVFGRGAVAVDRWWLVYLIFVTKLTDIGAFFIGKRCGKRKLAPRISPNKTVEGLIGGVLLALVGSVLFHLGGSYFPSIMTLPISLSQAILWGLVLALFGHVGDLAESLLKRDAKVKDSNKLPGLGGILDMVDSILFACPMLGALLYLSRG